MLPIMTPLQRCIATSCMPLGTILLSLAESKPARPYICHRAPMPPALLPCACTNSAHECAQCNAGAHFEHAQSCKLCHLQGHIAHTHAQITTPLQNSVRTNAKYVVCTAMSACSLHTLTQSTSSARQRPACAPTCPPGAAPPAACSRSWHASCGSRPVSSLRWSWSVAGSVLRARWLAAPHSS